MSKILSVKTIHLNEFEDEVVEARIDRDIDRALPQYESPVAELMAHISDYKEKRRSASLATLKGFRAAEESFVKISN